MIELVDSGPVSWFHQFQWYFPTRCVMPAAPSGDELESFPNPQSYLQKPTGLCLSGWACLGLVLPGPTKPICSTPPRHVFFCVERSISDLTV